jgi:STE24 endopeptidase
MLYLMSLFAGAPVIFEAFRMSQASSYAGLIFFGVLYAPISLLVSIYSLHLSRKYEFEADEYSRATYGQPAALARALKKLSADNLSNLNPHPLKVFLEYTHPPVLRRLERLST